MKLRNLLLYFATLCLLSQLLSAFSCGPPPCLDDKDCKVSQSCDLNRKVCNTPNQPCRDGAISSCYSGPKGTQGRGICRAGSRVCVAGTWGPCKGETLPAKEVCGNKKDDDCDGKVDDGCPAQGCSAANPCPPDSVCIQLSPKSLPQCLKVCDPTNPASCPSGKCVTSSAGSSFCAPGIKCTPGQVRACYSGPAGTQGKGICKAGKQVCTSAGQWGSCIGQVLPSKENCQNGKDDNCNGKIDDCNQAGCSSSNPCPSGKTCVRIKQGDPAQCLISCDPNNPNKPNVCPGGRCVKLNNGSGVCLPNNPVCQCLPTQLCVKLQQGDPGKCFYKCDAKIPCPPAHQCVALNNGSRVCLPKKTCSPGQSRACYSGPAGTQGKGICKAGRQVCTSAGQWGSCVGQVLPSKENCSNGKDDNCNGKIDDCSQTTCSASNPCPSGQACFTVRKGAPAKCYYKCDRNIPCPSGHRCFTVMSIGASICLPKTYCALGETRSCYTGPNGTQGKGICKAGKQACGSAGHWGPCQGEIKPKIEVCNDSKDNNCDGKINNYCPVRNCSKTNPCPSGQICIRFAGATTQCELLCDRANPNVCPNGKCLKTTAGNFCDPEGGCTPGKTRPCYQGPAGTQGKGLCKAGKQVCTSTRRWGSCVSQILPSKENCNNGKDTRVEPPLSNFTFESKQSGKCWNGER